MSVFPGYIKVNLPSKYTDYLSGNGEGVWVKVEPDVEKLHDTDYDGGLFKGVLDNDSLYYPVLKCGATIIFTMRGENRPVAIFQGFLDNLGGISEEEREALIERIVEAQNLPDK